MTDDLVTLQVAAADIGTSAAYLRVLISRGSLPAEKRAERGQIVNYVRLADVRAYRERVGSRRTD